MVDVSKVQRNEVACVARQPNATSAVVWRWQARAAQWLCFPLGRFLDFGCGRGGLIAGVSDGDAEYHGVDISPQAIRDAQRDHPQYVFHTMDESGRTPYADGFFDTVALVEVIEHVPNERQTLDEIVRILKPGGTLILTTPHRGLLTFLDLGNFKFIFPRLHRLIHVVVLRNRGYYEERFVRSNEVGLVGDIDVTSDRRAWHRHYRPEEITGFCPPQLVLDKYAVYFPGMRAFMCLQAVLRVLSAGFFKRIPWPLSVLERRLSRMESATGDQLVMRFTKERKE